VTVTAEIRTVIVERDIAFPAEKLWRALTQPHLIEEWLMQSDFNPVVGHKFDFRAGWGSVSCKVVAVEPQTRLCYTWDAMGLESTVTWTLTPTASGTHLRMEQSGFRPDQEQAYRGAHVGWKAFFNALETALAKKPSQGSTDQ
jgi:uncharacterized protein YndB with AHSA1/START domain